VLWQASPTGALFAAVAATLPDLDRFAYSLDMLTPAGVSPVLASSKALSGQA